MSKWLIKKSYSKSFIFQSRPKQHKIKPENIRKPKTIKVDWAFSIHWDFYKRRGWDWWLDYIEGLTLIYLMSLLVSFDFFNSVIFHTAHGVLGDKFLFNYFWAVSVYPNMFSNPKDWAVLCQFPIVNFVFVQTNSSVCVWLPFRSITFVTFHQPVSEAFTAQIDQTFAHLAFAAIEV